MGQGEEGAGVLRRTQWAQSPPEPRWLLTLRQNQGASPLCARGSSVSTGCKGSETRPEPQHRPGTRSASRCHRSRCRPLLECRAASAAHSRAGERRWQGLGVGLLVCGRVNNHKFIWGVKRNKHAEQAGGSGLHAPRPATPQASLPAPASGVALPDSLLCLRLPLRSWLVAASLLVTETWITAPAPRAFPPGGWDRALCCSVELLEATLGARAAGACPHPVWCDHSRPSTAEVCAG